MYAFEYGGGFVMDFYNFFVILLLKGTKIPNPPSYVCKSELIPKYGCTQFAQLYKIFFIQKGKNSPEAIYCRQIVLQAS